MRGISTVVDVMIFLLLVTSAVGTLVAGTGGIQSDREMLFETESPAIEGANILATSTATVTYSVASATHSPGDGVTFATTEGPAFERNAHGTLASLLADAVVGNVVVESAEAEIRSSEPGQPFLVSDGFEREVASIIRESIDFRAVETSVEAVWEPYPNAPISGRIQIGEIPPRGVDVHAATLQVESGMKSIEERAQNAARIDGYRGVARVIANAIVEGFFPPRETRFALRGDYPVDALTAQRYRRMALAVGSVPPGIGTVSVTESNDRLADALARILEADLRKRYESPKVAARSVETDTVDIIVRTWSP